MARAAKDAGLTVNGTEAELFKMMEQGKILAKDILPEFAKQLRQTAHDGGALTHALDKNLSVAIGQATFNLQQMSNAVFTGGLKDAIKIILDGFNMIAPKTKDLAFLFGNVLGGAVTAVTAPFVLFGAALSDVWTLSKKILGVNDEMGKSLLALAAKVAGLVLGFKLLWSIMKKVGKLAGAIKTTASAGGAAAAAGGGGMGAGALGVASKVVAPIAALTSANWVLDNAGQGDSFSASGIFGKNDVTSFLDKPLADFFKSGGNNPSQSAQSKDVNVNVKVEMDQEGNFIPAVRNIARGEVDEAESERIEKAMNSFYSSVY